MRHRHLFVVLLAPLACGRPDVEDLCEDLDEDCPSSFDAEDCVTDGQRVEEQGDSAGCEDQVTAYFECLEDDICTWDTTRCGSERDNLESCVSGVFPTR